MVEKAFSWFGRFSDRRPWAVILAVAAATAFFAAGVFRIHQEYGLKTMLPSRSQPVETMNEAEALGWGTQEEQVLIEADGGLDGAALRRVLDYREMLEKSPDIFPGYITKVETPLDNMVVLEDGRVVSNSPPVALTKVARSLNDDELFRQVRMNLDYWQGKAEETGLPLQVRNVIWDESSISAVLLNAKVNTSLDTGTQMKRDGDFTGLTEAHFEGAPGAAVSITGLVAINRESSRLTMEDTKLIFAIALGFILLVLFLTFRKVSDVLLTMMVIGVTIVWVMGLQGWLGYPFTYTGAAIMPLLLGIDIAYAIHVLSRYYEERRKGSDPHASIFTSTVTVGVAVFLTAATTAFGFASFSISNIPPIQQFGMLCVAGVLFSFFLAVTLLPATIALRDGGLRSQVKWAAEQRGGLEADRRSWLDAFLARVSVLSEHHRGIVGLVTLALIAGSVLLALNIGTEADIFKILPQDMPSMRAYKEINDTFGGQDLAFTLVKGEVLEPANLQAMLDYEDALAASGAAGQDGEPIFRRDKITGIADIVYQANGKSIPATREGVLASLFKLQESLGYPEVELDSLPITMDFEAGIIEVRLDRGDQEDMKVISEVMQKGADRAAAEAGGLKLANSGTPILLNEILGNILPTQLKTTALALFLCALIVILIFRSFFFGLAATSVVFLGVAMELGILALIGWPLDFMTVMVSSLVIGAGIDFGIHVTHRFMEEWREGGLEVDEAVRRTVGSVGKALVAAAVTTAGAFAIIAFSDISYLRRFGVITALSLSIALLAALFVLPSILAWKATRDERKRPALADNNTQLEMRRG